MGSWRFSNFYFFYFTTVGIIVPYWSLYLKYLQFTAVEIGELTAILVVTKVIAPNIWGSIADRANISRGHSLFILKWATGGALLIFCLLYFMDESGVGTLKPNYWLMAFVLFGFSVFWNACMPQVEAATLNFLGNERHRYGVIRLWGSIGFIIAVLGLGYVLDYTGPSIILHATALCFLAVFIASFFLNGSLAGAPPDARIVPIRQLLNRRVVIILVLCTLMQASHAPFYTFFSIYLESYDYSKSHIGWLWSVGVVFEIAIFMVGHRILKQYRLTTLLSITFLSAAVRWFLVGNFPENVALIWMAQILHAVSYGLHHSVMMQLIGEFFQGRYQVRGQALYLSMSFGIGGALGSVSSGYIWTLFGANSVFLWASVLMLMVALFSFYMFAAKDPEASDRKPQTEIQP